MKWKASLKKELVQALKEGLSTLKGSIIDENTWMLLDENIREVVDPL